MSPTACTYCGSDTERHDPVRVERPAGDGWAPAGRFCNYACLHAYIEEQELVYGTSCEWSSGSD